MKETTVLNRNGQVQCSCSFTLLQLLSKVSFSLIFHMIYSEPEGH